MSDAFAPQVRALLDGLAPPALSAGFADRVLAQAEATLPLPPLPRMRKPRVRSGRRVALTVGIAGLLSVAAAAAVVPAEVWRQVPVIGGIVELIAPTPTEPAPAPAQIDEAPAVPEVSEAVAPQAAPPAETEIRPVAGPEAAALPAEAPAVEAPPAEISASAGQFEPVERVREAPPQLIRATPVAERPLPAETRPPTPTVVDRPAMPAPERIRPAETRDVRQQTRERATDARQATRERVERRERQANRTN